MSEVEAIEDFYTAGLLTQIRFNMSDKNSSVKNKKLILANYASNDFATSSHERQFKREDGIRVEESYSNDKLSFYTEYDGCIRLKLGHRKISKSHYDM